VLKHQELYVPVPSSRVAREIHQWASPHTRRQCSLTGRPETFEHLGNYLTSHWPELKRLNSQAIRVTEERRVTDNTCSSEGSTFVVQWIHGLLPGVGGKLRHRHVCALSAPVDVQVQAGPVWKSPNNNIGYPYGRHILITLPGFTKFSAWRNKNVLPKVETFPSSGRPSSVTHFYSYSRYL